MTDLGFRVLPRHYRQVESDRQRRQLNRAVLITLFVLPGMALFALFVLLPIGKSAYYSFYNWNGLGPLTDFVAFDNYDRLLHNAVFQGALVHSFYIMFLSLTVQLPLALGLALLVGRGTLPGRRFFRTVLFIPFVFSEIITALIWLYVLDPTKGLANLVLTTIIPDAHPVAWLGDRSVVLYAVFAVLTWKYFGFHMILYMAGLQAVPKDLEDAARVDGSTELDVLHHVTLPMMGSTIRLTVFLSVLGSFQQFVLVWVLTEGGPVESSQLIATYLYKFGIVRLQPGYGSAVAVILFAITLLFSMGYQRIIMQRDYSTNQV